MKLNVLMEKNKLFEIIMTLYRMSQFFREGRLIRVIRSFYFGL